MLHKRYEKPLIMFEINIYMLIFRKIERESKFKYNNCIDEEKRIN